MAYSNTLTERQQRIHLYLKCAANLYGHITPRAFLVLFNRFNTPKLLKEELIRHRSKLMRQPDCNYSIYVNAIVNDDSDDDLIDDIIDYQGKKAIYIPSEEEFLKYENALHYEENEQTQDLREYLCIKRKLNIFSVNILMGELSRSIRTEEPFSCQVERLDACHAFTDDPEETQTLLDLLMHMVNNTRMWANYGHTPREMLEIMSRNKD
ncbi:MAG: hypothetical protein Q4C01_05520 [Clostridia bacterium]|nr:hypothetical protein [Clostridia bacterium]